MLEVHAVVVELSLLFRSLISIVQAMSDQMQEQIPVCIQKIGSICNNSSQFSRGPDLETSNFVYIYDRYLQYIYNASNAKSYLKPFLHQISMEAKKCILAAKH